jgi:hypothetical protein
LGLRIEAVVGVLLTMRIPMLLGGVGIGERTAVLADVGADVA